VYRTGVARLPLHYGKAPEWLTKRMEKLAGQIATIISDQHGCDYFLNRVSDPFWFQALGCVLGYDWHSSGVTTVVTRVLKTVILPEEHGMAVCGGKGRVSRRAPQEIVDATEKFGMSTATANALVYASKMSAKVDNTAIQAGYQLYHHAFFISEHGVWAVVQQGMCPQDHTARRYHWLSENVKRFVEEPHNAIVCDVKREAALNMIAAESEGCRKASVEIASENPKRLQPLFRAAELGLQRSLSDWLPQNGHDSTRSHADVLSMPWKINWKKLQQIYEFQPQNYEELLALKGVGPATVRGLALIAELIYGEEPSWKDPVKYSFAYGGKDGVPHPIDRRAMDESIQVLEHAIHDAKIGDRERMRSLQNLRKFLPPS